MSLLRQEKRPMRVVDWLNARLSLVFGLLVVMLLVGIGVSFYAFSIQRHADDLKVFLREDADGMQQAMSDQETGLRGYISDNDPAFLGAFEEGRPAYLAAADDLSRQLQTGPFQLTAIRLSAVEELADEWYNSYALVQISQMQAGHFSGPRSQTSLLQGTVLFNQFRAAVSILQDAITQDLEAYQNQIDTINISLVIGFIVLFMAANAGLLWILRIFTGTLQRQLVPLTETTQRLGQGERSARVVQLKFHDLDQVGHSINTMADAIQQHERTAEEYTRTLEQQYALVERAQSESRAIFDASSEAFLFISASEQVRALNRPFREFFALTSDEVVGISFADLQRQWEQLFANPVAFHADLERDRMEQDRYHTMPVIQQSPQYRELMVSSIPVRSSNGAFLGRLYVLRDVTGEREAERLKAEFYALISHGLRNPLTSIKGYTDLLAQEDETGSLTEIQQEFLGIIQSNTRRLMGLINDLIDLSRLEAHSLVIRAAPVDLHTIINDITQTMRAQIEERRQHLSLQPASEPLFVLGDENRVGQILTNLLAFATNHTQLGGRIVWKTQQEGSIVRIRCSSSGELSAEDLAAFNRPFLHASAQASSETLGSVLGPSIARSLVELHGGVLQLSSVPGEGTTLTCTLPSAPAPALVGENSSRG